MSLSRMRFDLRFWALKSGRVQMTVTQQVERYLRRLLDSEWQDSLADAQRPIAKDVILSLTSWRERLDVLPLTLLTLLRQRLAPARIIVWLAEDEFDLLPQTRRRIFEEAGVEFLACEDLGSHKKWIKSREFCGDPVVVLADDDIFYPADWLKMLVLQFRQSNEPQYIAHRCHKITMNPEKGIAPYRQWHKDVRTYGECSHDLFATSGAGVAFRPSWIPDEFYDTALVRKLSPTADDVWLKCAMLRAGIPVRRSEYYFPILGPPAATAVGLERRNVHQDMNTEQMRKTMRYFGIGPARVFNDPACWGA